MGKGGGELWDDSALIKAFDSAISTYKVMHATLPIHQTNQIGESDVTSQVLENATPELLSSAEPVDCSNVQNGSLPPNIASVADQSENQVVASDANTQTQSMWSPNDQEKYNQLWNKYYEVEEQRQKIIEQLNQYGDWNYQAYTIDTHHSEPQTYETVACHCPYGCQNLILPCTSAPDSCLGGNCTNKDSTIISQSVGGTSLPKEDPDIVKTAMDAAEKALSSLMKENYIGADPSATGGKNNELGVERDHLPDSANSATDLSMVLKAWYSAGFYTGKYLSEQSFENKKHC